MMDKNGLVTADVFVYVYICVCVCVINLEDKCFSC